jgi:hypothetical protein
MKLVLANLSVVKTGEKLAGGKAISSRRSAAMADGRRPGFSSLTHHLQGGRGSQT